MIDIAKKPTDPSISDGRWVWHVTRLPKRKRTRLSGGRSVSKNARKARLALIHSCTQFVCNWGLSE